MPEKNNNITKHPHLKSQLKSKIKSSLSASPWLEILIFLYLPHQNLKSVNDLITTIQTKKFSRSHEFDLLIFTNKQISSMNTTSRE